MSDKTNPLLDYWQGLTPEGRNTFARRAGSSIGAIRLAAHGYKTDGELDITPEFAARLEMASDGVLSRDKLAPVCKACPLAEYAARYIQLQH